MDVLKDKSYAHYDYTCRYSGIPYYYHTIDQKYVYGIGSNLKKDTQYVTHQVAFDDTLDSLALKYYGNPTLWWVIAYFNNIQDSLENLYDIRNTVRIPTISNIEFGADRK